MQSLCCPSLSWPVLMYTETEPAGVLHGPEPLWWVLGCAGQNPQQERRTFSCGNVANSPQLSVVTREGPD